MDRIICEIASIIILQGGESAYRGLLAIPLFARRASIMRDYYRELLGYRIVTKGHFIVHTRRGKYHRRDGPAVTIMSNDWKKIERTEYFYNGKYLASSKVFFALETANEISEDTIDNVMYIKGPYSNVVRHIEQTLDKKIFVPQIWFDYYSKGTYYDLSHVMRTDGPAVISNTRLEWRYLSKLHNITGPAYIDTTLGLIKWSINGRETHRIKCEYLAKILYDKYTT